MLGFWLSGMGMEISQILFRNTTRAWEHWSGDGVDVLY